KQGKTQPTIVSENGKTIKSWGGLISESFTNSGVFVLLGCMIIGLIAGPERLESEMNLFRTLFRGMLCLFLLDMGILAASRIGELRRVTPLIIPFAIFISVISGVAAVYAATLVGLSVGGKVVFAALAAGASYVTVPAAMRTSMPEANPSLYLGTALGVIFPWNVLIGLPLYLALAQLLAR
ncbi:MAG TPA: sodium-dependent bicarbonate transport family permease, partial [Bacteroidales bacterium]|nr:sodium-dependent bicarbonate transport family permease [Bacteroidales bacterium]